MPYSYTTSEASGSTATFGVPFPYLSKDHVHVSVDGVEVAQSSLVWSSPSTVILPATPAVGAKVKRWRKTPVDSPLAVFSGGVFDHRDLNNGILQLLYVSQEAFDDSEAAYAFASQAEDALTEATTKAGEAAASAASAASAAAAAGASASAAATFDPAGYYSKTATDTALAAKASKGANNDITSLQGLTTPLSVGQGGTGVSYAIVPAGTVMLASGASALAGTIKGNGALLSRAAYPALWAYAQSSDNLAASDGAWTAGKYSPGDGSTTFRIPDYRGEFPRFWDDGRGVDSGRAIGSSQSDDLKSHAHTVSYSTVGGGGGVGGTSPSNATFSSGSTGGTETRPRNIALLACIKY